MSGFSISPYSEVRFVGTDMGTLFRSPDGGAHWIAVDHEQTRFDVNLEYASEVGFSSDPNLMFFAPAGRDPVLSLDAGIHWKSIGGLKTRLADEERIKYWVGDPNDPSFMLAATTQGLFRTQDRGANWQRISGTEGKSVGTFLHPDSAGTFRSLVYHATNHGILISEDQGRSFRPWFTPQGQSIRSFSGGRDATGQTLAFIDDDGTHACAWASEAAEADDGQKFRNMADCGYVWLNRSADPLVPDFVATPRYAGHFVKMAANDSRTIYVTAGDWVRQYGSKVWISRDAGTSWDLTFQIYNWDIVPYSSWSADRLEYSAIGLDVGWDDNGYTSFAINSTDSSEAGGTGYYFLHVTHDRGVNWRAPFTRPVAERARGQSWRSTGLEVTSVLKLKFHPRAPELGYAALSDIGGLVTEDGGSSWRVSKVQYNTNYDYAFDPDQRDVVYAASGSVHDFPLGEWASPGAGRGGIFRSDDRGRHWTRLTQEADPWNRQYLAVAYDSLHKIIYGGCQGCGIVRSHDEGQSWEFFNVGLPKGQVIIAQLELDPINGDVYALVTGDRPDFTNQATTGIYHLAYGASEWKLLRGQVPTPPGVSGEYKMWWSPTAFAVDWSRPARDVLWLADYESKGSWLASGAWKTTDRGAHWERKLQFTHPSQLTIDPNRSDTVYTSGPYQVDGNWGQGGAYYTTDGGEHWRKNEAFPLKANLFGTRPDPNHPDKVFYLFFGGGMLYGPKPR
jgi:photosystem II stability/assembly factor-like uncharacterized protein